MTMQLGSNSIAPGFGVSFRGSTATLTREAPVEPPGDRTAGGHRPPKWQKTALVGAIVAGLAAVTVFAVSNDSGNDTPDDSSTATPTAQQYIDQALAENSAASATSAQQYIDEAVADARTAPAPSAQQYIDQALADARTAPAPTAQQYIDEAVAANRAANEAVATDQPRVVDSSVRAIEARGSAAEQTSSGRTKRAIEADTVQPTE